jgi:predicted DNA-binding transcriptional regulator AlpA
MPEVVKLLLKPSELVALGIVPSKGTLWRWIADGRFPKPIVLGPQARAFRKADVDRWLAEREAATAS